MPSELFAMIRSRDDRRRVARRRASIVVAVLLVAVGAFAWHHHTARPRAVATAIPTVPATIETVARRDVPVYRGGLGTVQAFNTVAIKARVDGQLDRVAFTEKQGDLLVQIDPRPFQSALDQALAKKAADEAQLTSAKLDLARFSELAKSQFATRQSIDQQQAKVQQLVATIQGDDATIENARVQLGYTSITAPISGRIGLRQVDAGNIVHAGDQNSLAVITQLHPIAVLFTLPEDALPAVQDSMRQGALTAEAFARDETTRLATGTLQLVDNQIDQATGTIKLKATFPNQDNRLWPGQFINVHLLIETRSNAIAIPTSAIQRGPNGYFAYVVKPDSTVEARKLQLGPANDGATIVEQGLTENENVVTAGQGRLQPGTHVHPAAPAASVAANGDPA
jgi:membrane fusion protein, multidrug efflux system